MNNHDDARRGPEDPTDGRTLRRPRHPHQDALHASLLEIWEKTRQTLVFVTHDLMEAITLSDRAIITSRRRGRVKASYPVRIPRPRDVIKVKDSQEYLEDFREIWSYSRRGVCLGPA